MAIIEVQNLTKNYNIIVPKKGLSGLVKREYITKCAVDNISFNIQEGEVVAYVGPNGAGKSTTIKLMTGILKPSSGSVRVAGFDPNKDKVNNAKSIGVVFGQKSQLYWDLPVYDSFELYRYMYEVPKETFKKNLEKYINLFELEDFINQPVRQLSLGQRMRANIVIALLHNPRIIYMDEPTLGLDVISKKAIYSGIRNINKEMNATIILTSHDMADIEAVCNRMILINHGSVVYDGTLEEFKNKHNNHYYIKLQMDNITIWNNKEGYELKNVDGNDWLIEIDSTIEKKEAFMYLFNSYNPTNIYISELRLEDIIGYYYQNDKNREKIKSV